MIVVIAVIKTCFVLGSAKIYISLLWNSDDLKVDLFVGETKIYRK